MVVYHFCESKGFFEVDSVCHGSLIKSDTMGESELNEGSRSGDHY